MACPGENLKGSRDSKDRPIKKSVKIQNSHFLPISPRTRKNGHWFIWGTVHKIQFKRKLSCHGKIQLFLGPLLLGGQILSLDQRFLSTAFWDNKGQSLPIVKDFWHFLCEFLLFWARKRLRLLKAQIAHSEPKTLIFYQEKKLDQLGFEPRNSWTKVRRPTDCATEPWKMPEKYFCL